MKFSLFAIPAIMGATWAAPIEKRQASKVLSIVRSLYAEVQTFTGAINSTSAGVDSGKVLPADAKASISLNLEKVTIIVEQVLNKTSRLTDLSDNIMSDLTKTAFSTTSGVAGVAGKAGSGTTETASGTTSGLTSAIPGLSNATGDIVRRQNLRGVSGVVSSLVEELSGTLDGVQKTVGVESIITAVNPLTSALSVLLGDLDSVVGGTITSVEDILKSAGVTLSVDLIESLPLFL